MTKLNRFFATLSMLLTAAIAQASPIETAVEAEGPAGPLKGIMLSPVPLQGPAALIVPGSGPTDRDGNNPLGVRAATYKLLAEELAALGVTTIRIDKRGMFGSAAATPDANAVAIGDYVTDVHSWVTTLRKTTGRSCIWLIGHSEGGLVAMAASTKQVGICGLVLVSAAGRSLADVLREQIKANPANGPLLGQAMSAIDSLEQGRRVDTAAMHPALQGLFAAQVQGFLISAFSYHPSRILANYQKPILVLQGKRDIQVSEADAYLLKKAAPNSTLVLLPNVNHVLKSVESEGRAENIATYADPGLPLAPGVSSSVADFIRRNSRLD